MVWCDVVWCGVVWCDVVWCGVVWCGGLCGLVCCCYFHQPQQQQPPPQQPPPPPPVEGSTALLIGPPRGVPYAPLHQVPRLLGPPRFSDNLLRPPSLPAPPGQPRHPLQTNCQACLYSQGGVGCFWVVLGVFWWC